MAKIIKFPSKFTEYDDIKYFNEWIDYLNACAKLRLGYEGLSAMESPDGEFVTFNVSIRIK